MFEQAPWQSAGSSGIYDHLGEFIIIVLVFVGLGYILGYLFSRRHIKQLRGLEGDVLRLSRIKHKLKSDLSEANTEIGSLKRKLERAEKRMAFLSSEGTYAPESKFDKKLASNEMGISVFKDDLRIIEGIGPKIATLLNQAGISTWDKLAFTDVATLRRILAEGGSRYRMHNPDSWPEQAGLATSGDWSSLKDLQDQLKGGVEKA